MNYYIVNEAMYNNHKWYLGEIEGLNYKEQWYFTSKSLFKLDKKLNISLQINGVETDFTESLGYGIPIISNRSKVILEKYNVVFTPLSINAKNIDGYYALGVKIVHDSIDLNLSKYAVYDEDSNIRPDRIGEISSIYKLFLKYNKVKNHHIFRVGEFLPYLIVSEEIKNKLEQANLQGFNFEKIEVIY